MQIEEEEREEERKEQELVLNSLESLIYKSRRDDVATQSQPLRDKLNFLLKWVEDDGQSASLDGTKLKVEEVKNNLSFLQSFHKFREVLHQGLRLSHGAAVR